MVVKLMKECSSDLPLLWRKAMSNDDLKRAIKMNTIVGVISILVTLTGVVVTIAAMM
jgi:hypothetical protein